MTAGARGMFVPIVNGLSEGGSGEAVMGAAALSIFGTNTTGILALRLVIV